MRKRRSTTKITRTKKNAVLVSELGLKCSLAIQIEYLDLIRVCPKFVVDNVGVAQTVVDDLRRAGVRIALDDFGTGYATLSQLLSFDLEDQD